MAGPSAPFTAPALSVPGGAAHPRGHGAARPYGCRQAQGTDSAHLFVIDRISWCCWREKVGTLSSPLLKSGGTFSALSMLKHLMNVHDNEHVELHELRGFVNEENLHEVLKEAEAIAKGTRCHWL